MYRTGDRGRLRDDGALMWEGKSTGTHRSSCVVFGSEIESQVLKMANGALVSTVVSVCGQADSQFLVDHVLFSQTYPIDHQEAFLTRPRSLLILT